MEKRIFDFNSGFYGSKEPYVLNAPLIGISANIIDENSALHFAYSQSVAQAGGVPVIIPANYDHATTISLLDSLDGVIFSGGADIDARYFGQENLEGLTEVDLARDYGEFMLLRAAIDRAIPIFGICRGFQLINIALGGDLYQDLKSCYPTDVLNHSILTDRHLGVHDIQINSDSLLYSILGCKTLSVNSRHHQAVDRVAPSLRITARSSDGVVEAFEGYPIHKIIGVQWHPENMASQGQSPEMKRLFSFFAAEAKLYRDARHIHRLNPIIDSHCDTPMLYRGAGFDLGVRNREAKVDLVKMREGYLDATITVAYLPQSSPKESATSVAIDILNRFKADIAANGDRAAQAYTMADLLENKRRGVKSILLGIENGIAIGEDLSNIDRFRDMGVRYITLCHNGTNDICDSAAGEPIYGGLSPLGREVVERMNSLGVVIDISHSSHQTTIEVLDISRAPIIASHSSCKELCDHPRNLSDEAIRAIAAKSGVVQICGYGGFLAKDREATILDLIAHIEHAITLVGYDHVGVGSDFDGDGGVEGVDNASEFMNITIELLRRGHSADGIAKVMGGNIFRVLYECDNIK